MPARAAAVALLVALALGPLLPPPSAPHGPLLPPPAGAEVPLIPEADSLALLALGVLALAAGWALRRR